MLYEIKQITKTYGVGAGAVQALRGVTLDIPAGKFIVMLGASGSGKSTLMNLIGGMDHPTQGEILYGGQNIARYSPAQLTRYRRGHVGFVFQSYNLLPSLTALENVEFVTELSGHSLEDAKSALRVVGLGERFNHYPGEMSGGEQQRVSIARAIAKNPDVLLCDEPTGALDVATGAKVLQALHDIHENGRTSVIVITHNQDIAKIADMVVRMKNGEVVSVRHNDKPQLVSEVAW